jgi:type II secretory pathway predicted ATPase ExeA
MHESPFEHISETAQNFTTPQMDDVFQSVLEDIQNFRPLSCVIGFPKSGKTFFLNRLNAVQQVHTVIVNAVSGQTLSQTINKILSPEAENKAVLFNLLREKKRILLFIDNAHLLTDEDFAFIGGLFTFAEHLQTVLQIVLIGNGEIVHRLARPDNRSIYNLLGAIWNLPKLTREQSMAYIQFLLDGAGLASDLITNPEVLAKRAAGVIGILRMMTITLALKALNSQESCDAEEALDFKRNFAMPQPDDTAGEDMPTQKMVTKLSPMTAGILALTMACIIGIFLLFFSWLMPQSVREDLFSGFKGAPQDTKANATPQAVSPAPKIEPVPGTSPQMQAVAKTVFRKRTTEGAYSLQLGSYPTMESLLLHLPRFADQKEPLFWNQDRGENARFSLFLGRFESFEHAGSFASDNKLTEAPVVFRPFVATVGPLTDQEQIKWASASVGLPAELRTFERELVNGVEIQFGLERSREDALDHCAQAEAKGLSCAVTQYE